MVMVKLFDELKNSYKRNVPAHAKKQDYPSE